MDVEPGTMAVTETPKPKAAEKTADTLHNVVVLLQDSDTDTEFWVQVDPH